MESTYSAISTPPQIVAANMNAAKGKTELPLLRMILLGIFAGMFIAGGASASSLAMHAISNVGLSRLVAGAIFPVGLFLNVPAAVLVLVAVFIFMLLNSTLGGGFHLDGLCRSGICTLYGFSGQNIKNRLMFRLMLGFLLGLVLLIHFLCRLLNCRRITMLRCKS